MIETIAIFILGMVAGFAICWENKERIKDAVFETKTDEFTREMLINACLQLYHDGLSDGFLAKQNPLEKNRDVEDARFQIAMSRFDRLISADDI